MDEAQALRVYAGFSAAAADAAGRWCVVVRVGVRANPDNFAAADHTVETDVVFVAAKHRWAVGS
jgi:hypothetical protein